MNERKPPTLTNNADKVNDEENNNMAEVQHDQSIKEFVASMSGLDELQLQITSGCRKEDPAAI